MNIKEFFPYAIASHFACAIVNGDETGLDDEESHLLESFQRHLIETHGLGDLILIHAESEFARDEVTGLMADCCLMEYTIWED